MRSVLTGNFSFLGGPFFIPVQSSNSMNKPRDMFAKVKAHQNSPNISMLYIPICNANYYFASKISADTALSLITYKYLLSEGVTNNRQAKLVISRLKLLFNPVNSFQFSNF